MSLNFLDPSTLSQGAESCCFVRVSTDLFATVTCRARRQKLSARQSFGPPALTTATTFFSLYTVQLIVLPHLLLYMFQVTTVREPYETKCPEADLPWHIVVPRVPDGDRQHRLLCAPGIHDAKIHVPPALLALSF